MKSCVGNEETFDKQEQQNGNESMSSHLFIYNEKWGIKSSSILLEMGNGITCVPPEWRISLSKTSEIPSMPLCLAVGNERAHSPLPPPRPPTFS